MNLWCHLHHYPVLPPMTHTAPTSKPPHHNGKDTQGPRQCQSIIWAHRYVCIFVDLFSSTNQFDFFFSILLLLTTLPCTPMLLLQASAHRVGIGFISGWHNNNSSWQHQQPQQWLPTMTGSTGGYQQAQWEQGRMGGQPWQDNNNECRMMTAGWWIWDDNNIWATTNTGQQQTWDNGKHRTTMNMGNNNNKWGELWWMQRMMTYDPANMITGFCFFFCLSYYLSFLYIWITPHCCECLPAGCNVNSCI